jgi:hypothetical protein
MQAAPAEVGATVSLVPLPRCLQPQPERLGHPLSKSKQTMVGHLATSVETRHPDSEGHMVAGHDAVGMLIIADGAQHR